MTRNTFILFFALTALLAAPGAVSAKKPGHRGHGGLLNPQKIERVAAKLGVDDETVARIKAMVYAARRAGVGLRAKLERARIDLHELMHSDQPRRAEVMKKLDELGVMKTAMRKHRTGLLLDVRALLTPDQRKKLKELMSKRRRHKRRGRDHRRDKRRGPGGGGHR